MRGVSFPGRSLSEKGKGYLLDVCVHVVELAVKAPESHDLIGDLLRKGPDGRVLDVPQQVFNADFLSLFGANLGLQTQNKC